MRRITYLFAVFLAAHWMLVSGRCPNLSVPDFLHYREEKYILRHTHDQHRSNPASDPEGRAEGGRKKTKKHSPLDDVFDWLNFRMNSLNLFDDFELCLIEELYSMIY